MSKLSVESFLDYLRRSELTDESRLKTALEEISRAEEPEKCLDADFVASELVKRGLITNWHVRQLMKKKYKGFYLRQYRILGHLGSGGMSTVYLAEHTLMQRRVAIKVLPKKRLANNVYLDRFVREAQASASLDHPNIVRAYDVDRCDDIHYIVMEYFEGSNLRQLVQKEGPLQFEDAVNYIRQAAEGLVHAHRIGVIHRDVKPENILVNDKGIAKLLDLGLALLDETIFNQPLSSINEDKILGTADYLAPEQALDSHSVDARADIYSLGGTLYYCLTGHAPFPYGTIPQRLLAHQKDTPSSVFNDRPDSPQDLVEICSKMMEKKPESRFQSATEVVRVLERWLVRHGFAEIGDFPDLARLAEQNGGSNDSTENFSGNEFFSGTFSYLSNSDSATEHGSGRDSFQFDADSVHSGVGAEDVVNLFGSGTVVSGSRSFSGSQSGFGSNDPTPEEIMLSKNAFFSPPDSSLDPLVLAMNEIETGILESSEKFAQNAQNAQNQSRPVSPVVDGDSGTRRKRTDAIKNVPGVAPTDSHQRSVADGGKIQDPTAAASRPSTSSSKATTTEKTTTERAAKPKTDRNAVETTNRPATGTHESEKSNAPSIRNRLNDETASGRRSNVAATAAVATSSERSSVRADESTNQSRSRDVLGGWYKEIPFWFWAVFFAGYVLATFLAGILFALLLNLNRS